MGYFAAIAAYDVVENFLKTIPRVAPILVYSLRRNSSESAGGLSSKISAVNFSMSLSCSIVEHDR